MHSHGYSYFLRNYLGYLDAVNCSLWPRILPLIIVCYATISMPIPVNKTDKNMSFLSIRLINEFHNRCFQKPQRDNLKIECHCVLFYDKMRKIKSSFSYFTGQITVFLVCMDLHCILALADPPGIARRWRLLKEPYLFYDFISLNRFYLKYMPAHIVKMRKKLQIVEIRYVIFFLIFFGKLYGVVMIHYYSFLSFVKF